MIKEVDNWVFNPCGLVAENHFGNCFSGLHSKIAKRVRRRTQFNLKYPKDSRQEVEAVEEWLSYQKSEVGNIFWYKRRNQLRASVHRSSFWSWIQERWSIYLATKLYRSVCISNSWSGFFLRHFLVSLGGALANYHLLASCGSSFINFVKIWHDVIGAYYVELNWRHRDPVRHCSLGSDWSLKNESLELIALCRYNWWSIRLCIGVAIHQHLGLADEEVFWLTKGLGRIHPFGFCEITELLLINEVTLWKVVHVIQW